jgi:ABC-type transporter Mla MlaB component
MSEVTFNLEGVLTIARVESLHTEFEELEKNAQSVNLNARDVSRVDTSVLQLLVALFRSLASRELKVNWLSVSDELLAAAKLLGLDGELNLR